MRPSEAMTPDQWAAKNRTYPQTAAVPGPRDPQLTPYVIEIERAVASCVYKRVVAVMGAQSGKSELTLDCTGARLDQKPGPVLYVGPNKQFLTEQFEPRVMALLDEAPSLMAKVQRGKRMTKTRKVVNGVPWRLAHSGSSTALKSDPAVLAVVDEYDEMMKNVKGQGGPLGLVERRGDTYADFVCVVTSTPSRGKVEAVRDPKSNLLFWDVAHHDELKSPIWQIWQQGTRHHWCWPCPHCSEYFVPRFNLLRYPETATPMVAAAETFIECPNCGGVIVDEHKERMNDAGHFVAPGQTIDKAGVISGLPKATTSISFWVSGLASPFVTFGARVSTYLEAVASGDDAEIQQAINAGFGEVYAQGGGEVPEWAELKEKSKRSLYDRGQVPDGVIVLTLTVDVQKQSLPWVLRGWGPRATSWLVDYGKILGDTADEEIWDHLANLVHERYDEVPIRLALVDSGFRPGKVDTMPLNRVYEFCRRMGRRVRATKGSSSPMRVPLLFSKLEINRAGKSSKYGLDLVRLDTDHWKQWVHERIRWREDKPGAWLLPKGMDDDYCKQVVGEARVVDPKGKPEWIERGRSHDYLDCEAMQAAAGYMLNVQRVPLPKRDDDAMDGAGRKPPTQDEVLTAPPPEQLPKPPDHTAQRAYRRGRRITRSNYLG
jgi:phage terminase large subunit GpA-like protein